MKLYFVRHGKTEWNLEGRFQGASGDSPLLETSIEQLSILGEYLADTRFDMIYSSDLPRAVHSAEIIQEENQFPVDIVTTTALREWHLGKLEGTKFSTMEAIYSQQMNAFRHNLAQFNPNIFEAESVYQTTHRTVSFIKLLKEKPFENVLFMGHGANLTASIKSLLGYSVALLRKDGGLSNGSLTILETDDFDHFKLLTWNNLDYLLEENVVQLEI